jgi:predicted transcriptional regulator
MAETEHSQKNIAYIRTHVDNIEQMSRFAIASNPNCREFVKNYLNEKKGSPEIYLKLSDEPKNLDELMSITKQSRANVSKICKHLFQQGLIIRIDDPNNAKSFKYCWGDLEKMLGVSSIAKKLIRGIF